MKYPLVQKPNWDGFRPFAMHEDLFRVYECVNCLRPVFTYCLGKDTDLTELATGVTEELLIFRKCFLVNVSTKCFSFNDNKFHVITCLCKEDLGYFVVKFGAGACPRTLYGVKWDPLLPDLFLGRGERIKARPESRDTRLMEFVENRVRSVLALLENQPCADQRLTLTEAFMAAAANAADEVASLAAIGDTADDESRGTNCR